MGIEYKFVPGDFAVGSRAGRPKAVNPYAELIEDLAGRLEPGVAEFSIEPTGEDVRLRTLTNGDEVLVDRAERDARRLIDAAAKEANVTAYKEFTEAQDGSLSVRIQVTDRVARKPRSGAATGQQTVRVSAPADVTPVDAKAAPDASFKNVDEV